MSGISYEEMTESADFDNPPSAQGLRKESCENCINALFDNDADFTGRGWYCWLNKWDNRGETENPVHFPTEKGLNSSCRFFASIFYE